VTGGSLSVPIACAECHTVPTTLVHLDGSPTLTFGTLASTGGGTPPSFATPTCSNVYCHGKTLESPSTPNPSWNGAAMVCGSCHDLTPTTGEHTFHIETRAVACQTCHRGFSSIDFEHHVNGTTEAVLFDGTVIPGWAPADCTACHTKLGV
jgi:predicted CxxxxCH...CXXCH cytochrome family protein